MQNIYDWRPQIDELATRKRESFPDILDEDFWRLFEVGKRFSMLHVTGFFNIWNSVKYVCDNDVPGDFVECGVWLGGASIFAGLALKHFGSRRTVHLYDTFAGFPENSVDVRDGKEVRGPRYKSFRAAVEANLQSSGVQDYRIVEGPVEETLKGINPDHIAVLRLDTDHYSSTKAEMDALFPQLSPRGILIVDDYGSYEGARRAVDEYLAETQRPIMLTRIDKSVRCAIKV